ncbi:L,D-transpeptidase family protein [Sphingomonas sinipercae]|uniref:L,D-transpeptidase family protein n=1 Tax=Sphingomonas sinipercae TaxID=2714944 RepID=A0A6G7ZN14_9SPHN|nr:L,D-transpeptidase family protein [Sphingomonas sinipercae]QIL02309.1 L,D-transpeptidase family protein [Sphingomonas sinipercae]
MALPYQSAGLATSSEVQNFYRGWKFAPIWFQGGVAKPATADLMRILNRAPLDGLANGPALAATVQAAMQRAAGRDPASVAYAEHTLSEAWTLYVKSLKRPTPGMIYAYDMLKPRNTQADQILSIAAGSASLAQHLNSVSALNPVYAQIRDAEWQRMQATGTSAPDPRVVANLDRARSIPATGKFAVVDAATQRLLMFENGQVVDSMKVVVGDKTKLGLPTPMIASMIYYMVHNPYWNVPHHLVRKTVAPGVLAQGPAYLKARGYEVMKDWTPESTALDPKSIDWKAVKEGTIQIRVRQKPSGANSMGDMKFPFANPEDIFLHDTPMRDYFKLASRDKSNGCVRLEDAPRFARWLLGHEPVKPSNGAEQFEQLPRGVPVFTTYLTAQPENGQLTFVKDIYGWDPQPGSQVATN